LRGGFHARNSRAYYSNIVHVFFFGEQKYKIIGLIQKDVFFEKSVFPRIFVAKNL